MVFEGHYLSYFLLPLAFFPFPFPYSYTSSPRRICTQYLVYVQMTAPHVPPLSLSCVCDVCLAVCFAASYLQVLSVIYCEHTVLCVVYEMDIIAEIGLEFGTKIICRMASPSSLKKKSIVCLLNSTVQVVCSLCVRIKPRCYDRRE